MDQDVPGSVAGSHDFLASLKIYLFHLCTSDDGQALLKQLRIDVQKQVDSETAAASEEEESDSEEVENDDEDAEQYAGARRTERRTREIITLEMLILDEKKKISGSLKLPGAIDDDSPEDEEDDVSDDSNSQNVDEKKDDASEVYAACEEISFLECLQLAYEWLVERLNRRENRVLSPEERDEVLTFLGLLSARRQNLRTCIPRSKKLRTDVEKTHFVASAHLVPILTMPNKWKKTNVSNDRLRQEINLQKLHVKLLFKKVLGLGFLLDSGVLQFSPTGTTGRNRGSRYLPPLFQFPLTLSPTAWQRDILEFGRHGHRSDRDTYVVRLKPSTEHGHLIEPFEILRILGTQRSPAPGNQETANVSPPDTDGTASQCTSDPGLYFQVQKVSQIGPEDEAEAKVWLIQEQNLVHRMRLIPTSCSPTMEEGMSQYLNELDDIERVLQTAVTGGGAEHGLRWRTELDMKSLNAKLISFAKSVIGACQFLTFVDLFGPAGNARSSMSNGTQPVDNEFEFNIALHLLGDICTRVQDRSWFKKRFNRSLRGENVEEDSAEEEEDRRQRRGVKMRCPKRGESRDNQRFAHIRSALILVMEAMIGAVTFLAEVLNALLQDKHQRRWVHEFFDGLLGTMKLMIGKNFDLAAQRNHQKKKHLEKSKLQTHCLFSTAMWNRGVPMSTSTPGGGPASLLRCTQLFWNAMRDAFMKKKTGRGGEEDDEEEEEQEEKAEEEEKKEDASRDNLLCQNYIREFSLFQELIAEKAVAKAEENEPPVNVPCANMNYKIDAVIESMRSLLNCRSRCVVYGCGLPKASNIKTKVQLYCELCKNHFANLQNAPTETEWC